jgi:Carbohydrate family 9 binding domain-like
MKRYRVQQVRSTPPHDLDWSAAELLTDFTFPWEEGPPPATEFRALWDEQHLHFRFDCVDEDLVLGEGETSRQRVLDSDRVEIFLTPKLTLNPYYGFEMAPSGEVLAYRARHYRQFDRDWTCDGLQFSGHLEERRYTVQGTIDMATLRALDVLKSGAREFFAGVYRAEFSRNPDGSIHQGWMPWINPRTERPDFHVPESFGTFELM